MVTTSTGDPVVRIYLGLMTVDEVADALFYVALGWVAARAGSPAQAAVIFASGTLPRIALLLLGGVVGDRLGVAKVAVWSLAARLLLMVVFAALLIGQTPGVLPLSLLAAAVGVADAVHMPAMRGVAGLLAEAGEHSRVQTLMSVASNGAIIAGTVGGGILLGLLPQLVGVIAAGLLVSALVFLVLLRRRAGGRLGVTTSAGLSARQMVQETVSTLVRDPVSRFALLLLSLSNMAATAPLFLGIPLKSVAYHWSPIVYGLSSVGISVGYIVGGSWAARLRSSPSDDAASPLRRPVLLMVPATGALVVLAVSNSPWLVTSACFLAGLFFAPTAGMLRGAIHERTPPEAMGRVNSAIQLAIYSMIPVGELLYGVIAGVSLTMAGLVMTAALVVVLAWSGLAVRSGAGARVQSAG